MTTAAPAGSALLCTAEGALVFVASAGQPGRALAPPPPAEFVGLARAGSRLVGVSVDSVYILDDLPATGRWSVLKSLDALPGAPRLLRALSQPERAVVWLRGSEPGTLQGALVIDAQGRLTHYETPAALNELGSPWAAGNAPVPDADAGAMPAALRTLIASSRPAGLPAVTRLLLDQHVPAWKGRLIAPDVGEGEDWPEAPLYYLPDGPGAVPALLTYDGKPLSWRGLLEYGPSGELLFDGRFSAARGGLLLIPPLAQSPPRHLAPLTPPCLFLPQATLPAGLSVIPTR